MQLDRLGWVAAAALLCLLLVQTARLVWLRSGPRRRIERARWQGREGERRAAALLERHGYRIEAVQPATTWTILCDDQPHAVGVRADLLVSRDGRRLIAEVKTGESAQLDTVATRRQLLEYSIAYDVEGVLLVDTQAERVQHVRFPRAVHAERSSARMWLVAAVAVAVAVWLVRLGP